MGDHEYHPHRGEFVATGLVGVVLYVVLIYFSVGSFQMGIKSKSTKRFFSCVICMSLLELPRFFAMAVEGKYDSRVAYCFHLLAGIFFFIAFSIVCRQWSGLLQLGSYFRAVYGLRGLVLSNVSFAIVDIVAVVACATASSLDSFFGSTQYEVITFIEGFRNCVYSSFLAYYGVKLVRRFWHFSRIERQAAVRKDILAYICYCSPMKAQDAVFTKVVLRMTTVLVLSSACFLCRVCMLIAKMVEIHEEKSVTSAAFPLFGFLWFALSDFLPRVLPTMAFIFLMRTKRPAKDMRQTAQHKHGADDDFQFMPSSEDSFSDFSDFDHGEGYESLYGPGGSSVTELMLKSDRLSPITNPMNDPLNPSPDKKHVTFGVEELGEGGVFAGQGLGIHAHLRNYEQSSFEDGDEEEEEEHYEEDSSDWPRSTSTLIDRFLSTIAASFPASAAGGETSTEPIQESELHQI